VSSGCQQAGVKIFCCGWRRGIPSVAGKGVEDRLQDIAGYFVWRGIQKLFFVMYGYFPYICINKQFMNYAKIQQQARFDARLTKNQKEFFELAASISGFKSLSEFVIHSTQQMANSIVEKHNAILASEADKKVFFDALANPQKPNKALKEAVKQYKKQSSVR
jgi:uncharacterized protein (DUF1778 family)